MSDVKIYRYVLQSIKGEGWAKVILASDGYFSACSDYGNYAFIWTHPGMEFRRFVAQLVGQSDYVVKKLCSGRADMHEYDGEATACDIRKTILEARRCRAWSKERARREWDLVSDMEVEDFREGFARWYDHTQIDEAYEYMRERPNAQCMAFCEHVMPRLAAAIREELAQEDSAQGPSLAEAIDGGAV